MCIIYQCETRLVSKSTAVTLNPVSLFSLSHFNFCFALDTANMKMSGKAKGGFPIWISVLSNYSDYWFLSRQHLEKIKQETIPVGNCNFSLAVQSRSLLKVLNWNSDSLRSKDNCYSEGRWNIHILAAPVIWLYSNGYKWMCSLSI